MELEKYLKWTNEKKYMDESVRQIVILSSFTVEPIESYLGLDLLAAGAQYLIRFGIFNQIVQQLTDSDSLVYHERTEKIIIWPRLEDMAEYQMQFGAECFIGCLEDARIMARSVLHALDNSDKDFIFVLPARWEVRPAGIGDYQSVFGTEALYQKFISCFIDSFSGKKRLLLCSAEEAIRTIAAEKALDTAMYAMAKIPYSDLMFAHMSKILVRCMALGIPQRPVLLADAALFLLEEYDCDGSIIQAVSTGTLGRSDAMRRLQVHINTIGRWGGNLLLYTGLSRDSIKDLCSQPEVSLSPDSFGDILYECHTWPDVMQKATNSKPEKANQFILLTPVKAPDIQADAWPQLKLSRLPEESAAWSGAISETQCGDFIPFSDQPDLQWETPSKETVVKAEEIRPDFQLSVDVRKVSRSQLESINHLLETVGDFRFTDVGWNENRLAQEYQNDDIHILGISVKDRFGDYGVAGGIIARKDRNVLEIVELMLNCRILGRKVEYSVIRQLADYAGQIQCDRVKFVFIPNDRNSIAGDFLTQAFAVSRPALEQEGLQLTIDEMRESVQDRAEPAKQGAVTDDEKGGGTSRNRELISDSAVAVLRKNWHEKPDHVKRELLSSVAGARSLDDIQQEIDRIRHKNQNFIFEYQAARTETEKKMVVLWEEILHLERVGVLDNFFALGGTSILATQLIIRFQQVFGIQMPVRLFFDKSNIEQMALYIDALQDENIDAEELNLNDIENYRLNLKNFLKREIVLDETIHNKERHPYLKPSECKNVLLTGGTGFVGPFILSELMKRSSYQVYCLVRADDTATGLIRIKDNMERYFLWDSSYKKRITIICGDLEKPLMGLESGHFKQLAQEIDMIYHNGANTNFLQPYHLLKPINVNGTAEVLRLAVTEKVKQVHFISTHYVFSVISNEPGSRKYEDEMPDYNEIVVVGYQQTKLVCEQLITIARERGIPVAVYRLGRVSGASDTGACQTGDFVWQMTRCCVESGLVFKEEANLELIPVDYIGKAVVTISLDERSDGRNFHIVNRRRVPMEFVKKWMIEKGFTVEEYPYLEWKEVLTERVAQNDRLKAVESMLPFITEDNTVLGQELELDTANTDAILAGTDVSRKEIDQELFNKYLEYFIKIGFFRLEQS